MKKLLRLLWASLLLSACTTPSDDPISYNNQIIDLIEEADTLYENYNLTTKQTGLDDITHIRQQLQDTTDQINSIRDKLIKIGPYEWYGEYFDAATEYLAEALALLRNEETKLLALWSEVSNYPDNQRTPAVEKEYKQKQQTIIDRINTQIQSDYTLLRDAQEAFAQQHNMKLEDDNTIE